MRALGALHLVRPNAAPTPRLSRIRWRSWKGSGVQLNAVRIAALVETQREGKSALLNMLCRSGGERLAARRPRSRASGPGT
jgi:hypothetical protein